MAVDRKLLEQALTQGQNISNRAVNGQGFDPRGGIPVALAQIATAGIGAFAQNRAKKQLAELEQQEQQAFATKFPQFAGLAAQTTPETRQAAIQAQLGGQIKQQFATPKFSTRDTAQGVVRINEATGEAQPITLGGQPLQPAKKGGTVVNVGGEEPAFRKKLEEGQGTKTSDRIDKIRTDADSAIGVLTNLDTIEENLRNIETTGPLDAPKMFINNLGAQLGLDINLDETASLEQINAASKALSVPLVKQLGVNPTDRDAKIIEATVAGLGKSKQANMALLNVTRQIANKRLAHANIADNLREEGNERQLARKIREYDLNNPIKIPERALEAPILKNGKLDVSKLKKGKIYLKNGIEYEYDGVGFIQK